MLNKTNKRDVPIILFFALLIIIPLVYAAVGPITQTFLVDLYITNNAPTCMMENSSSIITATDPTSGTTTHVWFILNVTDTDGEDNINTSGSFLNLTLGTPSYSQFRYNATCSNITEWGAAETVTFNCSINMWYYDNASTKWVINMTGADVNDAACRNDSNFFSYNELSGMSFGASFINFSGVTLGSDNQASSSPLILNNTGNDDFDTINLTGAPLIGQDNPAYTIPAAQFAVNSTNAVAGKGLALDGNVQTIPGLDGSANLTLPHGHYSALTSYRDAHIAARGNQSLYFWVDLSGQDLIAQGYNNTWNLTIIDDP